MPFMGGFSLSALVLRAMSSTKTALPFTEIIRELKKGLDGISQKVLTDHLRIMEENGIVNRKVYAEVPPKVEYSLTPLGKSLKPIHDAMWEWGEKFQKKVKA